VLLADKVALLENGTVTHVGTHAELLAGVPEYRYLLAADDELDVNVERNCAWEDDEQRDRLCQLHREEEATDAACAGGDGRRFAASEAERR
jgi:ATP-binding cassette subfamily B protein